MSAVAEPPPVLQAIDVVKGYLRGDARVDVLRGCSVEVRAGEVVAIRGRSGSGKSTLLNVVGLLASPDSGRVIIDGENRSVADDADAAAFRRNHIGFVFQAYNLLDHLTALENICLALDGSPAASRSTALAALYRVGLTSRADHRPNQLSGGEQQRVAVARALARRPSLLLADEPTGNLDRESEELVLTEMQRAASEGCGVLIVSHSDEVSRFADRTLHMLEGQISPMPAPRREEGSR